jgi:hypothetical protein
MKMALELVLYCGNYRGMAMAEGGHADARDQIEVSASI